MGEVTFLDDCSQNSPGGMASSHVAWGILEIPDQKYIYFHLSIFYNAIDKLLCMVFNYTNHMRLY